MSERIAPATTEEAAQFIRNQAESGSLAWRRLCLSLQRQARQLPAVYPTALSASHATPKSERVYDVNKWTRGMVGYSYDPRIPGTAGHNFFVVGRNKAGTLITASNDVKQLGAVDYVPVEFYTNVWGHKLQFACTWLNGYNFAEEKPEVPKVPEGPEGTLGDRYEDALDTLTVIYNQKRRKLGSTHPLVKALERDVKRMERKLDKWK